MKTFIIGFVAPVIWFLSVPVIFQDPPPVFWDYEPSWSPDGKSIVFASSRNSHPTLNIFTMNIDGSGLTQLTFSEKGWGNCFPKFSPDGEYIAFISDRDGNRELYLMDAEGASQKNLTNHVGDEGDYISFTPDGKSIYFERTQQQNKDIYAFDLGDNSVERITYHPYTDRAPSLHPNGKLMAFETSRYGGSEIAVMNLTTREIYRMTDCWADDGGPSWSSDGRFIYFYSNREDIYYDIWKIDYQNGTKFRITSSPSWQLDAQSSPDSKYIVYHSTSNGRYGIVIDQANGGKPTLITNKLVSPFVQSLKEEGLATTLKKYPLENLVSQLNTWTFQAELFGLADNWAEAGRKEEARELVTFAGKNLIDPEHLDILTAYIYTKINIPAPMVQTEFFNFIISQGPIKASAKLKEINSEYPDWTIFTEWEMNMLAYHYFMKEAYDEAQVIWDMCLQYYPNSSMALHDLAKAYLKTSREEDARRLLRQVVELNNNDFYTDSAKNLLKSL